MVEYHLVEAAIDTPGAVELRGGALEMWRSHDPEVIIAGPAETGKTIGCLHKLDAVAWKYPGAQLVIMRKTQKSALSSVVQSYVDKVLPPGNVVKPFGGERPEWYDYPNGSRVWIAGMDNADKVLSSERDIIYVNQAEELTLAEWETLTTRTTGRAGHIPHPQLIGDCNPARRNHWIVQRADEGKTKLIRSYHKDNPVLFTRAGQITPQGERTLARLSNLTGMRYKRLYLGEWATAEGVVYDAFDRDIHIVERDPSEFRYWLMGCDEGYTNPAVILLIGVDNDLRLHVYREFYERGKLQSAVVEQALYFRNMVGGHISAVVVDSSAAGLIADMVDAGLPARAHRGRVLDGIALVQELQKIAGDGKPRLTVSPECVNTINEMESYIWKPEKDEPVKENDHAMDALRYAVDWLLAGETEVVRVHYDPPQIGDY